MTILESPVHVAVVADRCAGCQECVIRCPKGALSMDSVTWTVLADDAACVGCRQCERTCPFGAISIEGPVQLAERAEVSLYHPARLLGDVGETRRGFADEAAALAEADRCLSCLDPTCVRGCPAHNDIPGFIGAIRRRDYAGAQTILHATSVTPDICSRVCNQAAQCEGACSWSLAGAAPVAIGRLERYITERAAVPAPRVSTSGAGISVGIIGSGPAGAGAAWDLVEAGCQVTVYEADATPGGLPVWGMPDFTLPDEIARRPWVQLEDAGVEVVTNRRIAASEVDSLLNVHDALIVAVGAGMPIRPKVPGIDADGVTDATSFLKGAKSALDGTGDAASFLESLGVHAGARVLVLGAGNTAMDVARLARRLDLGALCVDWMDERFALARPDELAEARAEGVEVRFTRTLAALHAREGRVARAELARTEQASAKRVPTVLAEDHELLDVDLVVMAMGYRNDPNFLSVLPGTPVRKVVAAVPDATWRASGLMAAPAPTPGRASIGELALGRESGLWAAALARRDRVWVAGDALTGPATVVEAMAQGRRAARSILDTRPSRTGQPGAPRVLVAYESVGGTTRKVAETIASRCFGRGLDVSVRPMGDVGAREIAAADVLVIGTWVEGFVLAGVRPAKAARAWLASLPPLAGRSVAVFCTYGVNPRGALDEMAALVEAKGARVLSREAFRAGDLKATGTSGPESFAARVVSRVLEESLARVVSR